MPSRLYLCTHCLGRNSPRNRFSFLFLKNASTVASSKISSPSSSTPSYPPTQPPSHRSPEYNKSQLHRQYTSLLRSSPLLLLFQHSNLTALEWMAIRRELAHALRATDESSSSSSPSSSIPLGDRVRFNVIKTKIFEHALLVVDHFRPDLLLPPAAPDAEPVFTHALSQTAYDAVAGKKREHPLHPLMCGPLAVLSFPVVSPQHLKTALSILSPKAPLFAAPSRRANPGYHDPAVQAGLQKLLLLGARVDGKVFEVDDIRWVGSIEGGMEGLRAQLVGLLGSVGAGVTGMLETAGRSLYYTLEGRKGMLEEDDGAKDSKTLEDGAKDTGA